MKTLKDVWENVWSTIDKLEEPETHVPTDKEGDAAEVAHELVSDPDLVSFVDPVGHVPGNDKDSEAMTVDELPSSSFKNEKEVSEAFETPDMGMSVLGRSLFTGAAVELGNSYHRNFEPDPPAPEEQGSWQDQDSGGTIVDPRQFVPQEEALGLSEDTLRRVAQDAERHRIMKFGK